MLLLTQREQGKTLVIQDDRLRRHCSPNALLLSCLFLIVVCRKQLTSVYHLLRKMVYHHH